MLKLENLQLPTQLTIYYDGGCKLCRSEIDNIAARDHASRLLLIDCNISSFDYAALGLTKTAMLNEIHARKTDGEWLRGVDVFIAMYQAVELDWIARCMAHPLVKPRAVAFYPWLVRNRHWLSRLGLHKIMAVFAQSARREQNLRALATVANTNSAACNTALCNISVSQRAVSTTKPLGE